MKTHLFLLHLLLLGALVPAHAAPLPAVHGRVYGQDEKGSNLGPLPGARIELLSGKGGTVIATATADSPGGYYRIKDLPPADYAYRVTVAGFKTEDAKRGFKVPQNSLEYVHDFLLTKPPAKRERCDVPVLVVKRMSIGDKPEESVRLPVTGARMILRPASAKVATPPNQPFIGSDKGELVLKGLAVGDYDVSIDGPECQPFVGQLKVVCDKNDQIIFELQPCDEVVHSLVRLILRDAWGTSPQAKPASARAKQSVAKLGKNDGDVGYAYALSQLSAGSYEPAMTTLADVVSSKPGSSSWDQAAGTRLWMLLCLHQPSQAMKETRSLVKNHYATRAVTPASRDTAQVCGLAIGLMRGPWQEDVGSSEANAFERDLFGAFQGELRQECEKGRDAVTAQFAKLKTAMDSARSRLMADAVTRRKEELARSELRQAAIEREVKALDAEIQKLQGMSQADEQLRIQLTGFSQQRQALAVQIRTLQVRFQQLAAMMSQQNRQMVPPTTQPGFPQDPRGGGKVPGRMPMPTPQQQPPQVNPQLQMEMQQIQLQLASLQQQDAQLAANMVNAQNRARRDFGASQADLDAKTKRREALAREFDTLDQQRVAPFDPAKLTTPELTDLVRRSRRVKTYSDLPLENRRQELLDLFTCGAGKDPPRTVPGASTKAVEIIEKDFPPPRQAAR